MKKIITRLSSNTAETWIYRIISTLLALTTILLISTKSKVVSFPNLVVEPLILYCALFIFSILAVCNFLFSNEKLYWKNILLKLVPVFLPAEILLLYAFQKEIRPSASMGFISALYIPFLAIYLIEKINLLRDNQDLIIHKSITIDAKIRPKKQDWLFTIFVILIIFLNLTIGTYHIGKFAGVDEPLWTFRRIPNFWENLGQKDWINTRVSDKPGLTIAAISGIGLLTEPNPIQQQYRKITTNNTSKMESFNTAFRLPIFTFTAFCLIFFYLLIKKLSGRISALFSSAFIGLSPILIGTARLINPDAILWIFVPLSLICYLIYLDKNKRKYLYLSGIFLGFGLLTKYVANILYVFFLVIIFSEYLFNNKKYAAISTYAYLKKSLLDYMVLIITSFAFFFTLYPAVWMKPDRLFIGTIYSEAFGPIWPLFASILLFIIIDFFTLKSLIVSTVLKLLAKFKKSIVFLIMALFTIFTIFTLLNVYSGMKFFDFATILASPKSAYAESGPIGIFFANFYVLIFGISPLAFIFICIFLIKTFFVRKFEEKNTIIIAYLLLFIMFYYIGSTISHVASTIRYQIILFPIILIVSGISIAEITKPWLKNNRQIAIIFMPIFSFLFLSLYFSKPFFDDYASFLLPKKYYLNLKDMGSGSYEAAKYLNALPNPEKITIWSDKNGVCTFFIGNCKNTLSQTELKKADVDYFVLSAGRRSRTTKMAAYEIFNGITFQKLYSSANYTYKLDIGDRPENYIKIIATKNALD